MTPVASVARRTTVARWLSLLVVLLAFTSCTPASPSVETYRERTKPAVTDTLSHIATAQQVLELAQRDKVMGPYALSTVRSSESTLSKVTGSYAELHPPTELDPVFTQATSLLGDASDLLTETRIALKRDDREG